MMCARTRTRARERVCVCVCVFGLVAICVDLYELYIKGLMTWNYLRTGIGICMSLIICIYAHIYALDEYMSTGNILHLHAL